MKRIYFTVTNDLTYDQRMIRICRSLAAHHFSVVLVGRRQAGSLPLTKEIFEQKRLSRVFSRGKLSYIEFNIRLFIYLLFSKADGICAIDLDTILPCLFVSRLRRTVRIYDAHELFTEMKEVISRPAVQKAWMKVERWAVPQYVNGYTVSQSILEEFRRRYQVDYGLIRNLPLLEDGIGGGEDVWSMEGRFLLYQGAVNEARGLEFLIPAMQHIDSRLLICGEGNLMKACREWVRQYGLEEKVVLAGRVKPADLAAITRKAYIGINLVEPYGLNQIYSLANKFFDYMHAAVPQVTMDFPEYRRVNDQYAIGVLIGDLSVKKIAEAINNLLENDVLHDMFRENCKQARLVYNWQEEEKKLIRFYQKILG
ncbi:MAG TPA: glycosyltransferase [Puia sp.]|nr:glycosyltransferase [Puia sp.]